MDTLTFETALGQMALARRGETVVALTFGHTSSRAALEALRRRIDATSLVPTRAKRAKASDDELVDRLRAFADGTPWDFDDVLVEKTGLTPFGRAVVDACRTISWGETVTYGELARAVGRPGAARAVGSVMARNRVPLVVPCHRVVSAAGGLGGFSAPQGVAMKRRLLALEQQQAPQLAAST